MEVCHLPHMLKKGVKTKYFAEDGRIQNVCVEIKLDCFFEFQANKDNGIKLQSKYGGNCENYILLLYCFAFNNVCNKF